MVAMAEQWEGSWKFYLLTQLLPPV